VIDAWPAIWKPDPAGPWDDSLVLDDANAGHAP
jgi:hypothetical protein